MATKAFKKKSEPKEEGEQEEEDVILNQENESLGIQLNSLTLSPSHHTSPT
jgi:hypothetical protein